MHLLVDGVSSTRFSDRTVALQVWFFLQINKNRMCGNVCTIHSLCGDVIVENIPCSNDAENASSWCTHVYFRNGSLPVDGWCKGKNFYCNDPLTPLCTLYLYNMISFPTVLTWRVLLCSCFLGSRIQSNICSCERGQTSSPSQYVQ